jgi:hypothetical protein
MSTLVEWFMRSISMPLNDAELAATKLRELPIDRWREQIDLVRELRALKSRLNVFRGFEPPPSEIEPWLAIWSLLP